MDKPFQHQVEGVAWLADRPHALLADEPGLGKSYQALQVIKEPALVVAPAMVLDSGTWDDEVSRWAAGAEITQAAYSGLTTRERTTKNGTRPTTNLRDEYTRPWGSVIADESHYLKGRKTHWTAAFQRLKTKQVHQATGTPLPNWAHEAFISLRLAYPEETKSGRRFGSYWRWAAEWFHVGPTYDRRGRQLSPMDVGEFKDAEHLATCRECQGPPRTWEEFQAANWGDRMLLRRREDCLDLPPLTVQEWRVKMTPAQARAYKALKKDFIAWLENGTEVVAWNQAAQLVRLLQIATGLEVVDPQASAGSGKLDALRSILKDRPRPTLVVAHFRNSVAACARAAREVGAEAEIVDGSVSRKGRREVIREFKAGGLPVLCATLDTISEGMTLTAADQVIRVERSWRPSRNDQVVRRLHRIGQERPVTCIDLITRGTADERVLKLLAEKSDEQMKALGTAELSALA